MLEGYFSLGKVERKWRSKQVADQVEAMAPESNLAYIERALPRIIAMHPCNRHGAMLDPADCGPACISMSQDVQGEIFEYPEEFFQERVHNI